MAEPHERRPRLKFKRILFHGGPLMPQGYRLATVEEIRNNLEIFKEREMPVKRISSFYEERSGAIRLLDGWVPADFNDVHDTPNYNCVWNAVVKEKEWNSDQKRWKNCPDFYSSGGNSLRQRLYRGINLTPTGIDTAWLHAYCYEDVELLYWLWQTFQHSYEPDYFTTECRPEHIFMGIDHSIPLRQMARTCGKHGSGSDLEMRNAREETRAVLRYAIDRSRDGAEFSYLYGPTWGAATVELAIELYKQPFVDTAMSIAFENAEGIPMITKFLSLFPDQSQNRIDNLQLPVAEVLIEAVKRGYTELVDHLLNGREAVGLPDKVGEKEKTLFHYALPHGERFFSFLVNKYDRSFDDIITRQDILGRNVIHWAAKRGYASGIVDILLRRPLSKERERLIHSKDRQRRTPWHIAALKEDIGMIEKLLHYLGGLDSSTRIDFIQSTDSFGQTALQIAASEGHAELVRILIKEGSCPLKERDGQRRTALHHAVLVKNPKAALATCKALLEHDEHDEHDSLSRSKCTLLLWASATGIGTADEMEDAHKEVKNYLQTKKEEYREHLLRVAAINDNVEIAWELLGRGADIADICDQGWTNNLDASEKKCVKNGK